MSSNSSRAPAASFMASTSRHCRDVVPEALEARIKAEQGAEVRRVHHEHIASAVAVGRNPDERVELPLTGLDEWVWPRQVDGLAREDARRTVVPQNRVVRQMEVEVKGLDSFQPPSGVEVTRDRQ